MTHDGRQREPLWCESDLPTASRDPEVLRCDLAEYGYCIVARALEGQALAAVQDRIREQAAAERHLHDKKNPANPQQGNQWVGMLLNKGAVFFELVRHPITAPLIEHLLGRDYLISCVDAQIQLPGSGVMPLHTDQWWMPPPQGPGAPHETPSGRARNQGHSIDPTPDGGPIGPAMVANAMWMITDFTERNGATRIVPRSHLSGRDPDPSVPHRVSTVAATGPAGTAVVFDGRLWHGAGANAGRQPRCGITANCCGPQCRQLENYTRGMRPEALSACPPEILKRLGFATWSSYGHTGDPDTDFTQPGDAGLGELRDDSESGT